MRTFFTAAALLTVLNIQPTLAEQTQSCASINTAQVESLFDRWNNSLATHQSAEVVKNYSKDSVLLATLANDPRLTQEQRIEYFDEFLKKKPRGTIDSRVIQIGCNWAADIGTYTFTLRDGSKVPARYTYTYVFENDNWLISSHHSSMMPE